MHFILYLIYDIFKSWMKFIYLNKPELHALHWIRYRRQYFECNFSWNCYKCYISFGNQLEFFGIVFLYGAFIISYSHRRRNGWYRDLFIELSNTCTIGFGSLKMIPRYLSSSHNIGEQSIFLVISVKIINAWYIPI